MHLCINGKENYVKSKVSDWKIAWLDCIVGTVIALKMQKEVKESKVTTMLNAPSFR
jgi:hypothetical protein